MKIRYTRITSPSYTENIKLRIMIIIAVGCLFLFSKTIFVPGHGGYRLLYIPLCITLSYMCLKYLHEWYHYFAITAPPLIHESDNYSVDIFTTYCKGEPLDMLEATLEAISLICYPHTSWCCDEDDDPVVKEMCSKYGIRHITRTEKKDAKAGNINNALQFATGEICVILDPDHIPVPEFLDVVLPYFKDEKVGFVQVVQAYHNHYESLVAKGAAQQTYQFYGPMMMSMYAYGTVQALGANCTFRRAALNSIGGHAAGLAEDMHTAMKLHAKGWTSVYVPAVVARGLVPSTLSAYYKQQLKWARGTFELLVSSYPKLFKNFTLFQKIHYFLLPFHYFSGLIFLLNFLIPVFSLFLGEPPLVLDFSDFVLAAIPLACMIVLIRQYVQKWVVEENERGFHIVGGLLQIGTWWVYLTGFVYTIVRKKIPYIPTPKDDSDPMPLSLHLPNLFIIILSIAAIVYGLNYDWTPFSLFMSGIAFINICILLFVIYASYKTNRRLEKTHPIFKTKQRLWYFRHWAYKFARDYALILSVLVIAGSVYVQEIYTTSDRLVKEKLPAEFYNGVFEPASDNGFSEAENILQQKQGIQIVSYYVPWTESSDAISLPLSDFNKLYKRHIIPLLTLEPWLKGKPVFDQIISGQYDSAIDRLAKQLAAINKPVFFRFAHEPENPRYPWSFGNGSSPASFVEAWKHLHKKFEEANAKKIVWVWNPWKNDSLKNFFPGQAYVDWLGVNVLDYAPNDSSISFEHLYQPFHNDSIFKLGLPVMIAEAGTLSSQKEKWWSNAWEIMKKKFPEIRAVIAFNNEYDHYNANNEFQQAALSWKWNIDSAFRFAPVSTSFDETIFENDSLTPAKFSPPVALTENMHAVVYDKGVHWFRNVHTASIKVLQTDVKEMKALGVNTIFRTLPDIYSKNFFKITQAYNLSVVPQLWADLPLSKLMDDQYMQEEQERLVKLVKGFKEKENIVAWNLSNDLLYNIETSISKPDRFAFQTRYIKWLQQLIEKIKQADAAHPVIVSVKWNDHAEERVGLYKNFIANGNQFLLNVEDKFVKAFPSQLPAKFSWGIVDQSVVNNIPAKNVVPCWQDQQTAAFVSLNGLLDLKGRIKEAFDKVNVKWNGKANDKSFYPAIKILRPAKLPFEGQVLNYHAVIKDNSGNWTFASGSKTQIRFEWYLVYTDAYGNPLSIKPVAKGEKLSLKIPSHPELYFLYLEAISKNSVSVSQSPLGLPLDIDAVK